MLEDRTSGWRVELFHSIRSAFYGPGRLLKQFLSQGVCYALRLIPGFDGDGLWVHSDLGFSSAGSLPHAPPDLITRSSDGVSAEQLGT